MNRARKTSVQEARAFLRRAHLIDSKAADVGAAIAHHGYVQIDPLNICGRMQDHILRNRVHGYEEGGLMRHLHGDGARLGAESRTAFEHHLPSKGILVALPTGAWPHLLAAMRARSRRSSPWSGRLTPREKDLAKAMLERISEVGALGPEAFSDERRGRGGWGGWGAATLSKAIMQKLFFHGRLLIAGREKNRRIYDLPEKVLPAEALAGPEKSPADTAMWAAMTRMKQHRLVALKRAELLQVGDLVQPIAVEGCPTLYCLASDLGLFEAAPAPAPEPLLLAPLDPMIYDRRVTLGLWDFDYTWEVYTPAPKRKRGYYALPVLSGTELVGHVDLKADRLDGRLRVVSRSVARGHRTAGAVAGLARFLGLGPR